MESVLPAELAVFVHFNPFRIVPLVLLGDIVAALAFCTSQCYFHSHDRHLLLVYFFRCAEVGFAVRPEQLSESFASLRIRMGFIAAPKRVLTRRWAKK